MTGGPYTARAHFVGSGVSIDVHQKCSACGTLFQSRGSVRNDPVRKKIWTDVNEDFPPDRWTGKIKIRAAQGFLETDCFGFQKRNPITGAENDFWYQHGTVARETRQDLMPKSIFNW